MAWGGTFYLSLVVIFAVRHQAAGGNVAASSPSRPVQATDAAIGVDMHDGVSTSLSGFIPENLDTIVHSKADVLIARSTVSGLPLFVDSCVGVNFC